MLVQTVSDNPPSTLQHFLFLSPMNLGLPITRTRFSTCEMKGLTSTLVRSSQGSPGYRRWMGQGRVPSPLQPEDLCLLGLWKILNWGDKRQRKQKQKQKQKEVKTSNPEALQKPRSFLHIYDFLIPSLGAAGYL